VLPKAKADDHFITVHAKKERNDSTQGRESRLYISTVEGIRFFKKKKQSSEHTTVLAKS
jgi:hypothetical protein